MGILRFAASLLVFVVLQDSTRAYPNGVPPSACMTMYPKHMADPQTSAAPYSVVFSSATYSPGQTLSLRVMSTNNGTFKGLILTAHRVASSGNTEEFVGTFNATDNSTKTMTCLGAKGAALGHNGASKKTMVNTKWTAPDKNMGDLQFLLTVVQNKTIYWYKVPFTLQAQSTEDVVAPMYTVPSLTVSATEAPDWSGCQKTKGCWLVPEPNNANCTGNDCRAALSYRKEDDKFVFEMSLKKQDEYIAVGFSDDKLMGDDQTVMCTAEMDHESVQEGYNIQLPTYKFSDRQFTRGVSDLVVGKEDGRLYCKFTAAPVLSSVTGDGTRSFNLSKQHYLFLAWGHVYHGSDVMGKHTDAPAISTAKVDLTKYSTITSTAVSHVICCSLMAAALVMAYLL